MAVPEQTPYQEYTANGVATSFAVAFQCLSKDTLIVTINGVEQSSTLWSFTGGNIVFVSAPLNNSIVGIKRTTSLKREVTYNSYSNSMLPTVFNSDFDRIWHVLQEYQFSLDGKVATSRKINTSGNLQGGGSLEEDLTLSLKDQAVITDYQFGSSVKIPVITLNQDGTVKSIFESDLSGITPALTYIPWANVLNKPNTLNGYGITNAYTKLEANAAFIEDAEKGVASGIAPLDANTKVDPLYLPAATALEAGVMKLNNTLASASETQALTAAQGKVLNDQDFGVNQAWVNVRSTRLVNTLYTNDTNKPISVSIANPNVYWNEFSIVVGGVVIQSSANNYQLPISIIFNVPVGATYRVNSGASGITGGVTAVWAELR